MSNTGRAHRPSDLTWGAPPPQARHNTSWQPIAAALRERPSQWAQIADYGDKDRARSLAAQIRYGMTKSWLPRGHFEAAIDGGAVWARYVGEGAKS